MTLMELARGWPRRESRGLPFRRRGAAAHAAGLAGLQPYWSQYLVVAVLGAKAVGQRLLPRPAIRYRCARRQSRIRQLVRSAIDENGELEHEA